MEEKKKSGRPRGKISQKYSPEFKQEVVEYRIENKIGFKEAARRFLDHVPPCTGCAYILKWERIYLEEGPEGLAIERRGRSRNGGRPSKLKLKPEIEKDLIERIQNLEMENEYLKKLKALVSKREQQAKRKLK